MSDELKNNADPPAPKVPSYGAGADPLAVAPHALVALPSEIVGLAIEPVLYDPEAAMALLDAYRPRLAAIPPDRVQIARVNVDAVGRCLLAVCGLVKVPSVHAQYEAAAKAGLFDGDNLAHLEALTQIALYAYRQAEAAGVFKSSAKIPAELDEKSDEVKKRMKKVCEHYFSADPELGPVLVTLAAGSGYLDRANDLLGYLAIYLARKATVSQDPVHYKESDIADAKLYAGQILGHLGAGMAPAARQWFDTLQRVWTLLEPVYAEVRALGLAILRFDPKREERLPSLYVVGRAGQGRKKKAATPAPEGGEEAKGEEAKKEKKPEPVE